MKLLDGIYGSSRKHLQRPLWRLEQLPAERQPTGNMDDMKKLLAHAASGNVSIHLAQAKIRFNPDLDPMTVYRSYGISGPDEE